jgi:uncharacterized protein
MDYAKHIAEQLNLGVRQVEKTIELLESGATVPFVARYRKEATGNLNEVQIAAIRDMLLRMKELDKRREAILQSIPELGIVEQARISAARLLIPIIQQMGFKEENITIVFPDDFDSNNLRTLIDNNTTEQQ